jgi:UDP-N-acetylglucosamine--N-acetylmuramyl-(pentapeptide) pyrophosphoryl-undecaprenol N-acetylglucosamine transferase
LISPTALGTNPICVGVERGLCGRRRDCRARNNGNGNTTRLLVASTGGHLAELVALAPRFAPVADDEVWVTFESQQSKALLAGRRVEFVRDTPPRDWRSVAANTVAANRILNERRVDSVVSTGAGIALSFLPLARMRGVPSHYIESCARTQGPSMTGSAHRRVPGVSLYTQHRDLADRRWRFAGSILDSFEAAPEPHVDTLRRVFVTVGTLDFSFRRLFRRLQEVLPDTVEVVVQAGSEAEDLEWPGARKHARMRPEQIHLEMAAADVVVAHAGIGSALDAFRAGKLPLLVPRLVRFKEHVDDHQVQIAQRFSQRGLAVTASASELTLADLQAVTHTRVTALERGADFPLS